MTTHDQLLAQCQRIADELSNPLIVTESDLDYYPDAEVGDPISASDYFDNCLSYDFTITGSGEYRSVEICMAFGGPGIWINSGTGRVDGYWGEHITVPFNDNIGVDDYFEDLYNCTIGANLSN